MLRLPIYHGVKTQTVLRAFSASCVSLKKSDDEKPLDGLIANLTLESKEESLDGFLSKAKSHKHKQRTARWSVKKRAKPKQVDKIKEKEAQEISDFSQVAKSFFSNTDATQIIHKSLVEKSKKKPKNLKELPQKSKDENVIKFDIKAASQKEPIDMAHIQSELGSDNASQLMNALMDSPSKNNEPMKLDTLMRAVNGEQREDNSRFKQRVCFETGDSTSLFAQASRVESKVQSSAGDRSFVSLFEVEQKQELKDSLTQGLPQNAFEVSMLSMDRQWQFPINNEQDMGVEDETTFDQHVFLDHLLEQFPDNDQVQKFMELVVTGLQQNPYLTVDQKEKQILWFKDYFKQFPDEDWIAQL